MKKIEAVIRKTKFDEVKEALLEADIEWFSYYEVRGIGKSRQARIYRGVMYDTSSIERILISIVVRDRNAERTVEAIIKHLCKLHVHPVGKPRVSLQFRPQRREVYALHRVGEDHHVRVAHRYGCAAERVPTGCYRLFQHLVRMTVASVHRHQLRHAHVHRDTAHAAVTAGVQPQCLDA